MAGPKAPRSLRGRPDTGVFIPFGGLQGHGDSVAVAALVSSRARKKNNRPRMDTDSHGLK
jgi:hypothetical protein